MFEFGYDLTLISCLKKRCCDKETSQWPIFSFCLKFSFHLWYFNYFRFLSNGFVYFRRCHVPFKVLTRISWMILHICDVPSPFQESPVWYYFDFHGIHEKVSSLSNYRLCRCLWLYQYMNVRTVDPLLKHMHEFSLIIYCGGLCHLWLYIFNKIKVYWNVWVFDYFHSSFCINTSLWLH